MNGYAAQLVVHFDAPTDEVARELAELLGQRMSGIRLWTAEASYDITRGNVEELHGPEMRDLYAEPGQ